ncbi:MAG: hypothetical protein ABIB41_10545 [Nitrospirota bacterium]
MSRRPVKLENDWVSVIISDSFDAYQAVHSLTGVYPHFDARRNDSYVKALNAFVLEIKCKVKFTKLIDLLYKLNAYSYLVV